MADYKVIYIDGKREYEHRVVMSEFLGRPLLSEEYVHHKDGNPKNNHIDNLQLTDAVNHRKLHAKEKGVCRLCEKVAYVKGLCSNHYRRPKNEAMRRAKGVPKRKPRGICVVDGCVKYVNARGLCLNHYRRKAREGMAGRAICNIDKCDDVVSGLGLCNKHYKKKRYYEQKQERVIHA